MLMRVAQKRRSPWRRLVSAPVRLTAADRRLCLLFNELEFDRRGDVFLVVTVSQKFADRCASNLAIIARKFVHVHTDELTGELRVHVSRICERVSDGFVTMCET